MNGPNKIRMPLFVFFVLSSAGAAFAQPVCNPGEVRAIDPNANIIVFSSIQDAVDAAQSGWQVFAGPGFYPGIVVVDQKVEVVISTECEASAGGFLIKRSSYVSIENFDIDASGTGQDGITLLGGINKNDNILIRNNDIHDAGSARSGISVARDNTFVSIIGNTIHENDRNGVVFIDSAGGPNFVSGNTIVENGWNGVRVNRQHEVTLTNNNLSGNGTSSGSSGGRYGLLRERVSGSGEPEGITVLFNRIEGNQGNVVPQQSSQDLGNYDQMLDVGDSGNITTAGSEAAATGLLLDCNLFNVWQTVDNFQLFAGQNASPDFRSIGIDDHPNSVVDDGNVYVSGLAEESLLNRRHGIVRKTNDGGLTWRIVKDIPPGPGSFPLNSSLARAFANDLNGNIYVTTNISSGAQQPWTVETSTDQGATWQAIDNYLFPDISSPDGDAATAFDIDVLPSGDIYVVGTANNAGNFYRWVVRRRLTTESVFTTVDAHDQDGTPAQPLSVEPDALGNLFVAGAIFSPGFRWSVRRSATGAAGTWTTVDQFLPGGVGPTFAAGVQTDSLGRVLVAGHGGSPRKAFVRRSADSGATWEDPPLYTFQLSASADTTVFGFEKDMSGSLYLMLLANDGASNRWVVQKSTDDGQTFTTIDNFLFPGLTASGAHSLVEGHVDDRSLYVAGSVGDFPSGTGRWVVRKLPCLSPRSLTTFSSVAAAVQGNHSCAIANDGSAKCWGRNSKGQVGNGQFTPDPGIEFAVDVVGLTGVTLTAIGTGTEHTCGVASSGATAEVRCWGGDFFGQLGTGPSGTDTATPISVAGTTGTSVSVSVGADHTCAIADGILKCWGRNDAGQLGLGDQFNRSVPTTVGIVGQTLDVAAGFNHTCAVVSTVPNDDSDNEVQCWGHNGFGAVGVVGGPSIRPSPVAVPGTQGTTRVVAGVHLSCGLINEGVKCWGDNTKGQLGRGTLGGTSAVPSDVLTLETGTGAGVSGLDAGDEHACAIVLGGLRCWGNNANGELGNNRPAFTATTPVQVAAYGPGSNLLSVSAGRQYTCASNGYVTCWGDGVNFKRGDGLGGIQLVPHPVLVGVP